MKNVNAVSGESLDGTPPKQECGRGRWKPPKMLPGQCTLLHNQYHLLEPWLPSLRVPPSWSKVMLMMLQDTGGMGADSCGGEWTKTSWMSIKVRQLRDWTMHEEHGDDDDNDDGAGVGYDDDDDDSGGVDGSGSDDAHYHYHQHHRYHHHYHNQHQHHRHHHCHHHCPSR